MRDQGELTQDIEASWADLAQADAAKGYRAICSLVAMPEKTVPWLKDHLKPGQKATGIRRWIADLGSDTFAVREAGSKELAKNLPEAAPPLREALLQQPSPEARRRIEALLALDVGIIQDSELLRSVRGIQVLEYIGTPEAHGVLKSLSHGDPEARVTQETKASLERLGKGAAVNR